MVARLLLATSLIGAAPAAVERGAGPMLRMEYVRVVHVSPRPPASGIFASYADFDVAAWDGETQRMYLLWAGESQYLPEAGFVCTIGYRREPLAGGNLQNHDNRVSLHANLDSVRDDGPHNIVHDLNCGLTPGAPPLGSAL